jgi:uncharacterized protein
MNVLPLVLGLLALVTIPLPPAPTTYVTDRAGVLDSARALALNEQLAQLDRATTNQILVYVDRRVPDGTTLEEMSAEAIRTWAVGDAKKDNGIILFLFVEQRVSRIEVGYGHEGVVTDSEAATITRNILIPRLRDGDTTDAVEATVAELQRLLTGTAVQSSPPAQAQPAAGTSPRENVGEENPWVACLILLAIGTFIVVRRLYVNKRDGVTYRGRSSYESSSSSYESSWSWSSDSSSSSSSSSSFSGGGGSGGGGGASGSW